jgi:5'(3')-deoxyribonucleotidase
MDGTLADFFGAVAEQEGASHWRRARKEKKYVDQVAQAAGFFMDLEPLPECGKLVRGVVQHAGSYQILSSPLMSEINRSSREKHHWLQRHLGRCPPEQVLFDHHKEKYARQSDGTPNILIDDWETNIKIWEACGGIGILHKDGQVGSTLRKLQLALEGLLPVQTVQPPPQSKICPQRMFTRHQVLKYVQGIHNEYHLEKPILRFKTWVLTELPLVQLKTPEFYDQDDPYRRVIDLNWDHIVNITSQDMRRRPVVADEDGWVLDGNHRVTAARALGLKYVRAIVPYNPG